jgi:hypothetical protein
MTKRTMMTTRTPLLLLLTGSCILATAVVACIIDSTYICLPKGTTRSSTTTTHCVTSGGLEADLPSWTCSTAADCTTPYACLTFGSGYWDYSAGKTSCTVPVDVSTVNADCSITITIGAGTITVDDCDTRTPTGTKDCPPMEAPPPGGGNWCLKEGGYRSFVSLTGC